MEKKKAPLAVLLAATLLPLAVFAGALVEMILKLTNPDKIDITQGLAYLGYIIGSGVIVAAILLLAIIIIFVSLRNVTIRLSFHKLIIWIVCLNALILIGAFGAKQISGVAEDDWSRNNNQPTRAERDKLLDDFFKKIEKDN